MPPGVSSSVSERILGAVRDVIATYPREQWTGRLRVEIGALDVPASSSIGFIESEKGECVGVEVPGRMTVFISGALEGVYFSEALNVRADT